MFQEDNQASYGDRFVPQTPAYKETNDLVVLDNPEEQEKKFQEKQLYGCHPLESYFDTICDNLSYKVRQNVIHIYENCYFYNQNNL